jgi:hypothetical protein
VASRQTISDGQAEPEFQENHERLKADRLAREAALNAKAKMIASSGGVVSSLQQLFCSFDGTAILIRPVRSPMQVSY